VSLTDDVIPGRVLVDEGLDRGRVAHVRRRLEVLRGWWPEAAWSAFVLSALWLMTASSWWQPICFHLIWVSVMVLYGYRLWSLWPTMAYVVAVGAITGATVLMSAMPAEARLAELTDVPLMYLMFMVVVWHARRRSDALAKAQRAAERELDFVRDASHQLRTPITIARGHTELIASDRDGTSGQDAAVVLAELERLERIADRLLILASAEDPRCLMLEAVPFGDIVAAAAVRWTVVAGRDWTLEADAADLVLVDRARIDAALDALIENAIKATRPGEAIALRALVRDGVPAIEVADRGRGVEPAQRERIFERFTRVPPASGGARGGTGLGLPMVRAIADAHGGSARLADGPEGWTTFELRLARLGPAAERTRVLRPRALASAFASARRA
jgi:signal transduction histidine kinase